MESVLDRKKRFSVAGAWRFPLLMALTTVPAYADPLSNTLTFLSAASTGWGIAIVILGAVIIGAGIMLTDRPNMMEELKRLIIGTCIIVGAQTIGTIVKP